MEALLKHCFHYCDRSTSVRSVGVSSASKVLFMFICTKRLYSEMLQTITQYVIIDSSFCSNSIANSEYALGSEIV